MGGKVCTETCVEECPAGWTCTQKSGVDPVFICLSSFPGLCLPCMSSETCTNVGGGKCALYDPQTGAFCGAGCDEDTSCPTGYECKENQTSEGQSSSQCVRVEGECPCTQYAVTEESQTGCVVTNEFGTCSGWRICTEEGLSDCSAAVPAGEVCDGMDNDCDGMADDGNLCHDDNECTEDSCGGDQRCLFEPTTGIACFDGDSCTQDDHCEEGICIGEPVVCDDEEPCTADICDAGECAHPPGNDGEPCQDEDPCTMNEYCEGGICVAGG